MRMFKLNKVLFQMISSFSANSYIINNEINSQLSKSLPNLLQWQENLKKAEKHLNHNLSNFTLQNLLNKEKEFTITTLQRAELLKIKLGLKNHPIIHVIENVFKDSNCLQSNNTLSGFYLLLLAKITETVSPFTYSNKIWEKQKAYAEVCEVDQKIAYIHSSGLIDISDDSDNKQLTQNLNAGNKLCTLGGDYLYALNMIKMSQNVMNTDLLYLNGLSIDNFCTNNFTNSDIDWKNITFKAWTKMQKYNLPSALGNYACGIVKLANLTSYEEAAFNFGYNLRIKWNIEDDVYNLIENKNFNLFSAPVVVECENNSSFAQLLSEKDLTDLQNKSKIREMVLKSDAIKKSRELIARHSQLVIDSLNKFPDSQVKYLLIDLIKNENRQNQEFHYYLNKKCQPY